MCEWGRTMYYPGFPIRKSRMQMKHKLMNFTSSRVFKQGFLWAEALSYKQNSREALGTI